MVEKLNKKKKHQRMQALETLNLRLNVFND